MENFKYFKFEKTCPICNNNLTVDFVISTYFFKCKNKCYTKKENRVIIVFYIFGKKFLINKKMQENEIAKKELEKVEREIDYWKENDRYLIKLLE